MALTTTLVASTLYGANEQRKAGKSAAKAAKTAAKQQDAILNPPRDIFDTTRLGMAKWAGGGSQRTAGGQYLYNTMPTDAPKSLANSSAYQDLITKFPQLLRGGAMLPGMGGFGGQASDFAMALARARQPGVKTPTPIQTGISNPTRPRLPGLIGSGGLSTLRQGMATYQ